MGRATRTCRLPIGSKHASVFGAERGECASHRRSEAVRGQRHCVRIAPDLFEFPDDSDVVVVTRAVVRSDELAIRDAVRLCPKQALSIEENR